MMATANPVCKPGRRNFQCVHYGNCLDHAVAKQWNSWSCSECPNRYQKTPVDAVRSVGDKHIRYELPQGLSREIWHRFS